jgi:hypothetical protein
MDTYIDVISPMSPGCESLDGLEGAVSGVLKPPPTHLTIHIRMEFAPHKLHVGVSGLEVNKLSVDIANVA